MNPAQEVPPQTPGSSEPDSPLDFSRRDWKATARRTLAEIRNDRITLIAAAMAYYAFIAIFPAVNAAVGIVSLVHVSPTFRPPSRSRAGVLGAVRGLRRSRRGAEGPIWTPG